MIESFERDWANPSLDVRKRHRSMAERLDYDLLQDYLDCRDAGGKLEMEFPPPASGNGVPPKAGRGA